VRVTERLVFDNATRSTARALENAQSAANAASTGLRVIHPSDDPAAAGLMAAYDLSSARLRAVSQGAAMASDELKAADGALGGIADALSRAKELAVQLSNANYDAVDRTGGAAEVAGLLALVLGQANTRVGNRYIFGGTRDASPPFPSAGTYAGDQSVRQVEVAPGVLSDASVRADVALGVAGTGGTDVVGTLQALQAALAANDQAGVQAQIGNLTQSLSQVSIARSQAGVALDAFSAAESATRMAADDEKTRSSKLGEVDIAQSAIQLASAQQALQASLAVAAQGFKLSLLDYL
jgi:flagellar hook-associated protein 3 FlgL